MKKKYKLKVVRTQPVEWLYRKHHINMTDNGEERWYYIDNYVDTNYDSMQDTMDEIDDWEDE